MGTPHFARLCGPVLAATAALFPSLAGAHGIAGNRFFPATLTIDDPAIADELSLPTVAVSPGDDGVTSISGEYSKRLTSSFGLSFGEGWDRIGAPGQPAASGFENLETTAKWQFLTSDAREAIVSAGASVEWGGTGAWGIGADQHTTITPTVYFGKGAGDLPEGLAWARPFALTGQIGYAIPSRRRDPGEAQNNPRTLVWGFAVEYSLPYLQAHVRDVGLPAVLGQVTPLVEASFETPLSGRTRQSTGTINPGLIWAGRRFQLGAEAMIPVNAGSNGHVGALFQVHMYLDDLFPRSLGRPIW